MKKLFLLTSILICCINGYAFNFMGVEIAGDVEKVADKLAEKGFTRMIRTVKEGPDKGKSEVVKLNDSLYLEGRFMGYDAWLILKTLPEDGIVSGLAISIEEEPAKLFEAWKNIGKSPLVQCGDPDFEYDWRVSPEIDDEVRLLKYWEFRDFTISLIVAKKTNSVILSFENNL